MVAPESLFAEAQALYRAGQLPQAREFSVEVLRAAPHHGGALHLLGLIAFRQGARGEAAAHFAQAAALALAAGDADTALQRAVEAVTAEETPQTRRLFADVAGALRFTQDEPVVRPLLARALKEEWGPLPPLVSAAAGLVTAAGTLESDDLLRAALAAAPFADAALERALTAARHRLLAEGGDAGFAIALAQQCFLNGYVFASGEAEAALVQARRAAVEAGLAAGAVIPEIELAVLACYRPLHQLAGIEKIVVGSAPMQALLWQQRDEPAKEKRLAADLPALTPIAHAIEDEDPWPRWSGKGAAETAMPLRAYLQARFPHVALGALPETPAMLAAGCGTGQYALHLAHALQLESVTAIDLSRTNLAYAARKARDANRAIRFGQGDILESAALGRRFGLIECGGVLHQLPDHFAGWTALLAALAPGGVMRLAVHSATARAALKDVQTRLARDGFDAGDDGVRAARQALLREGGEALRPILEAPEFFTLGGCRHLLFPGAEHPLSLPAIAAFLRANRLVLLGLEVPAPMLTAYRARFPADAAATDLDNWAAFEQENPRTFAGMVHFWVQQPG